MTMTLTSLHSYAVKGFHGTLLDTVSLTAQQGFPLDRCFGFVRPGSGFDPNNPAPLPKTKFVVLARDAGLVKFTARYHEPSNTMMMTYGRSEEVFDLDRPQEHERAAAFLSKHLQLPEDQHPTFIAAAPHRFTDVSVVSKELMNAVSLINLDSVAAFGQKIGAQVDPGRFRANIAFKGAPPFRELDWLGHMVAIGDVRLRVVKRTKRCAATQVNLQTGARDLDVPALLHTHLGHMDMGVYAEVMQGGQIAPGDQMRLVDYGVST